MRKLLLTAAVALLALPSVSPGPVAAQQSLSGWFHVVYGDPQRGGDPQVSYLLTDAAGNTHSLVLDLELSRRLGGPQVLDRRWVQLDAAATGRVGAPLRVRSISASPGISADARLGRTRLGQPPQSGSKPYVAILCRFADSTAVEPRSPAQYRELIAGTGENTLDHYWKQASEARVDLSGSEVFGWYDLPEPKAAYFKTDASGKPDLGKAMHSKMTEDCTRMADADVDFSRYSGVLLQFNGHMGFSWGGGGYLRRDGVNKVVPMTWMASWATHGIYAHEIGHSFGLPHSSGPYGEVYDSRWDVMSDGGRWIGDEWVAVHTIGYHRDLLGWIPSTSKFEPASGTRRTFLLERSTTPSSADAVLLAQIPLEGGRFYSVEARRFVGYDRSLPHEAVVLHHVDPARSNDIPAAVVDEDANGDPNDEGAAWLPGETFRDTVNGVMVRVDSATASAYRVTIRRGFELRVDVEGTGTVSAAGGGLTCSEDCDRLYAQRGAKETLSALPGEGWLFLGWRGACSGSGTCTVSIDADRQVGAVFALPLRITSDAARGAAVMGAIYSDRLETSGGTGDVRWALLQGKLPAGLSLDSLTGSIKGIAEEAGSFRFAVRASSESLTAVREFALEVTKPVLALDAVLDHLLGSRNLTADQERFLDLIGNRNDGFDIGDVRAWLVDAKHISGARIPPELEAVLQAPGNGK